MLNETSMTSIKNYISKIQDNSFDETTILGLLITIRESVEQPELREICDFIAHTQRNKGIFFDIIKSRYLRLMACQECIKISIENYNNQKIDWESFVNQNIDYDFYNCIDKDYFNSVFLIGIEDLPKDFFADYLKDSKKNIKNKIKNSYKLENAVYNLVKNNNYEFKILLHKIQTTIKFTPIFDEQKIIEQLIQNIKKVTNNKEWAKSIRTYSKDIFICIICLLHDISFVKDKNIQVGTSFISVKNKKICLICSSDIKGQFYYNLLLSSSNVEDYLESKTLKYDDYDRIPFYYLKRNNKGALMLSN